MKRFEKVSAVIVIAFLVALESACRLGLRALDISFLH